MNRTMMRNSLNAGDPLKAVPLCLLVSALVGRLALSFMVKRRRLPYPGRGNVVGKLNLKGVRP